MKRFFSQLKKEVRTIRLSSTEKEAMRRALEAAFVSGARVKSPIRVVPSPFLFISDKLISPLAFILILTVIGSGTAYAAEDAMPGDVLYTVKVNVNERVVVAIAASAEAKAEIHARLAERRMEEAETLAARGELTMKAKTELETRFETHAARVDEEVETIEQEDPVVAADISSRFESSLAAHGALIEKLGEETEDETSRRESVRLASTLKERGKRLARALEGISVMAARNPEGDIVVQTIAEGADTAISASVVIEVDDDPVAKRLGSSASSTLEEAEVRLNAFQKNLNATTAERVKKQIEKTREFIKNLRGKDKGEYEKALKDAKKLDVFIEAQEKFRERTLLPALEINDENEKDKDKDEDDLVPLQF